MNNPFEILGISENSTDEQIRDAYRFHARRYQEQIDSGVNPEYARMKMQELDSAYDSIIMSRSGGGSGNTSYNQSSYYTPPSDFSDIRTKIRDGRLDDAQTLLDGIPTSGRTAEWYFLKGCIQQRRGWLEEANGNFAAACRMDPSNQEYKAAYDNLQNSGSGGYRTTNNGGGNNSSGCDSCSACDICQGLLCADCCCECMGGDLISCC